MRHATGAAGPTFKAKTTGNGFGTAGFLTRGLLPFVMIAGLSGGLFWFTAIYEGSLRDPRYLDGWLLAGGMGLQLFFHIGIKSGFFSPRSVLRWRTFHIFLGYLLIAAFVSHCDFSWPDTAFEWMLWIGFVLVTDERSGERLFRVVHAVQALGGQQPQFRAYSYPARRTRARCASRHHGG